MPKSKKPSTKSQSDPNPAAGTDEPETKTMLVKEFLATITERIPLFEPPLKFLATEAPNGHGAIPSNIANARLLTAYLTLAHAHDAEEDWHIDARAASLQTKQVCGVITNQVGVLRETLNQACRLTLSHPSFHDPARTEFQVIGRYESLALTMVDRLEHADTALTNCIRNVIALGINAQCIHDNAVPYQSFAKEMGLGRLYDMFVQLGFFLDRDISSEREEILTLRDEVYDALTAAVQREEDLQEQKDRQQQLKDACHCCPGYHHEDEHEDKHRQQKRQRASGKGKVPSTRPHKARNSQPPAPSHAQSLLPPSPRVQNGNPPSTTTTTSDRRFSATPTWGAMVPEVPLHLESAERAPYNLAMPPRRGESSRAGKARHAFLPDAASEALVNCGPPPLALSARTTKATMPVSHADSATWDGKGKGKGKASANTAPTPGSARGAQIGVPADGSAAGGGRVIAESEFRTVRTRSPPPEDVAQQVQKRRKLDIDKLDGEDELYKAFGELHRQQMAMSARRPKTGGDEPEEDLSVGAGADTDEEQWEEQKDKDNGEDSGHNDECRGGHNVPHSNSPPPSKSPPPDDPPSSSKTTVVPNAPGTSTIPSSSSRSGSSARSATMEADTTRRHVRSLVGSLSLPSAAARTPPAPLSPCLTPTSAVGILVHPETPPATHDELESNAEDAEQRCAVGSPDERWECVLL